MTPAAARPPSGDIDGAYAWRRLLVSLALATVGGIGLWSVVVTLPAIQAEFGIDRSDASLPYAATLSGFAVGSLLMGRAVDRFGIARPMMFSGFVLGAGYIAAAGAASLWQFILVQGLLIGLLGCTVTFGPLVADVSHWFNKRRGLAIAVVSSGNYLAGTLWPPVLQYGIETVGWRQTHIGIGIFCMVTMAPLALYLRRPSPVEDHRHPAGIGENRRPLGMSRSQLQMLIILAGLTCCIAMAMPQVHIVAYAADLGYGAARGAEMLSIMLGMGIVSRLASGFIADRIGGVGTLILGSALQCLALLLFLPFDGLSSLYAVAAFFGLAQGGIVPSYALIARQYFPAREAGMRVSIGLTATVVGMALGGWMSGEIYDLTGSYQAAFLNGFAFNLINISVALWLLKKQWRRGGAAWNIG
jgi:MFS family permease